MPNFKIVRKGYDTFEVNKYIEGLEEQIAEFKLTENYINKALISAEKAASDVKNRADTESAEIISQAKAQADKLLSDAKNESDRLLAKTQNQISLIHQREKDKMENLKQFVQDKIDFLNSFNSDYISLVKKYFETPNNEEFEKLSESLKNITALIDSFQNPEQ